MPLVALIILLYLAVLAVGFISLQASLREALRPTLQTSDDLRRRVIGPFLRKHLNRLLADHDIPAMTQSQDLTPADSTIDA